MALSWEQLGNDFSQKYQDTFCRYVSPLTQAKETFRIIDVHVHYDGAPDIVLHNERAGEIFLNYNTEADLDFTFPEVGCFQFKDRAVRFIRLFKRQWRKGLCSDTAKMIFPYGQLWHGAVVSVNEQVITEAFKPREKRSITDGIRRIGEGDFSVALGKELSIGHGDQKKTYWLWFAEEPVAEVIGEEVRMKNVNYLQEIADHVRDTRDNVRVV